MKIYLATLATPTLTSELYEFSIGDLCEIYDTKAFTTFDEAKAWGHGRVIQQESEMSEDDPDYETSSIRAEYQDKRGFWWIVWSTDEDCNPEYSYALKIWEEELG